MKVKAKKHLGQHFLKDKAICEKIAQQFSKHKGVKNILEIGPGTGALTEYLLKIEDTNLVLMDIDTESIAYLKEHYPSLDSKIIYGDFLNFPIPELFNNEVFAVVGNFPYNISSQILFKCLEYKDLIPEIMGMFQKEVAERIAIGPNNKAYGILSILLQTYYDISYCFTVDEHVFDPPPKVKSGVIKLHRNDRVSLPCDEKLYKQVIKTCFNQRRKMIRNSIKPLVKEQLDHPFFTKRPENLSVEEYIELTLFVQENLR